MQQYLDREAQLGILTRLAGVYPQSPRVDETFNARSPQFLVNLYYLSEHGLVEGDWINAPDGSKIAHRFKITAKGLDFLQDDGGLSAILGTITVRLHDDTIRALLIERIEKSDADPDTKGSIIAAIKALPAEGLRKLAEKALDAGIERLPEAIGPLRGWLGL